MESAKACDYETGNRVIFNMGKIYQLIRSDKATENLQMQVSKGSFVYSIPISFIADNSNPKLKF